MRQLSVAATPVFAASILFTLLATVATPVANAASVTASANSYEVGQSDTQPVSASAFIQRHGPGAPGSTQAGANSAYAALDGFSTMVGCGFALNNFQQVCNDARSTSTFLDRITITAGAPNGTPVQVRAIFNAGGMVDGKGGYSYTTYAHVNGVNGGVVTGGTGGTVQTANQLPISGTYTWTVNLQVGTAYEVTGYLFTNVINRWCAGGSADCEPSATSWTMSLNLGSALQLELVNPAPPGAQIVSESGHDYTVSTLAANGSPMTPSGLSPARPNPSRGPVSLSLALAGETPVDVAVFDLAGRRVATLARGTLGPGSHTLAWDGRDDRGGESGRGVYFVRAKGPGIDATRRVLRLE
jgi:hypothetical protein